MLLFVTANFPRYGNRHRVKSFALNVRFRDVGCPPTMKQNCKVRLTHLHMESPNVSICRKAASKGKGEKTALRKPDEFSKGSVPPEQSFARGQIVTCERRKPFFTLSHRWSKPRTSNLAAGVKPNLNLSHREFLIFAHYLSHFSCTAILVIIPVINQSLFAHGPCF
jgi:hypothetical protein